MTGTDRLRAIAGAWDEWGLGGTLADIADQIERERECERDTIENLRLEMGEARDDAAWVRDHGGLDAVEDSIKTNEWALSLALIAHDALFGEDSERDTTPTEFKRELDRRLMPEGMEWPRFEDGEKLTLDNAPIGVEGVEFPLDASGYALCCGVGPKRFRFCERVKRPAPKVLDADGAEIEVGDDLYSVEGLLKFHVSAIDKKSGRIATEAMFSLDKWADPKMYTHRAPVLAADGEPLEVGQTVWDTNGDELIIGAIEDGGHTVTCRYADVGDGIPVHGMWAPSDLTHQRPVLDADGVPIDEGDTVWNATTGAGPFTVREIERSDDPDEPEDIVWCGEHAANGFKVWRIADQLTHTKPEIDTWQRIEDDAGCTATKYNERRGTIFTTKQQVARDLVRRCRALAERERGE